MGDANSVPEIAEKVERLAALPFDCPTSELHDRVRASVLAGIVAGIEIGSLYSNVQVLRSVSNMELNEIRAGKIQTLKMLRRLYGSKPLGKPVA